jgi:ATP-dependent exoDNAse (exonuclease V) beta subunit
LDNELENAEFSDAVVNAQRLGLPQPLKTLRDLAGELHKNYDLVARIGTFEQPNPVQSVDAKLVLETVKSDLGSALDLRSYCTNPDDRMLLHLDTTVAQAANWIDEALEHESDEERVLALTQISKLNTKGGRKPDWDSPPSGESSLEEVRALLDGAQQQLTAGRQALGESTIIPLLNSVSKMVLEYAGKRRSEGMLEFQDLLVLSCELLDANEEALKYFQNRYTHVLIDEFQDTDPLQLKLAMRLTDRSTGPAGRGVPTPGALFVVGDGKQSIYRFRRSDLTQLRSLVESLDAEELSLTENYRSDTAILDWVNAIFEPWMNGPDGKTVDPNQADYVPFASGRNDLYESDKPRVIIAGGASEGNVGDAREAESDDLAALALSIGAGEWSLPDGAVGFRTSKFRDLCVLMPRRTALSYLENAFVANDVPYVLEGQAPIFESQTVHELSNNLAAIDDPTDQVAITAALKSPAWGCSDQDLYEWAKLDFKFEYARQHHKVDDFAEGTGPRNVASALVGLAGYHEIRQQYSTPYLIEKFVRDRRLREVAALSDPLGESEKLMDLFIEMSRTLQRSGTGSLREFVRWIARQAEASVRVAEGALASSETNAVRVMTVHAAKGLEFPIVVLMGLQVKAAAPKDIVIAREENGKPVISVKLGSPKLGLTTPDYGDKAAASKDADAAEQVRLAYVGATRAREHLVVSVHRSRTDKSSLAAKIGELDDLNDISTPFQIESPAGFDPSAFDRDHPNIGDSDPYSLEKRTGWINQLDEVVEAASGRGYVTPSALADHTMFEAPKPEDNAESTEWNTARRGRGGTDMGSAVHSVLQDVEFGDHSNLDELIQQAVDAYGLSDSQDDITHLVNNVLASPTVAGASASNSWREAWVAAEVADGVEVEGAIDLIIRNTDESVTIVDYKTDRVTGADLQERAKGYEPQLAGYAIVLKKLGMTVRDAVLVFADGGSDGTAYEYVVPDLDAAKILAIAKIRDKVR